MAKTYRRIVLAARPSGMPGPSHFRMQEAPLPDPGEGQVLVRNIFLSIDPYMRGRMRDAESYAPPVQLGEVMVGGTAGQVVASRNPRFAEGTFVNGMLGWQEYGLSEGKGLRRLDPAQAPISTSLGVLGMPGMTAYFGLLDVGKPQSGETVVVSAAAGAVGALVGQIAKIHGCRAVGIAGGPAKCGYILKELGYDAAIDYKAETDLRAAVKRACPGGVDIYFDNVGGPISDAVIVNLNLRARVPICGQISQYNRETPELAPRLYWVLLTKRARMEGFIVTDYGDRWGEGLARMAEWLREGKLKYKEDIVRGLENAPGALQAVLEGRNFGKQLVQLAEMPASAV
jgi:NADPH-dependent curcumin reductase CurA